MPRHPPHALHSLSHTPPTPTTHTTATHHNHNSRNAQPPSARRRQAMHTRDTPQKNHTRAPQSRSPHATYKQRHQPQQQERSRAGRADARVHYPDLKQQPHTTPHPHPPSQTGGLSRAGG